MYSLLQGYQVILRVGGSRIDADNIFGEVDTLMESLSTGVKHEESANMVKRYEIPSNDVCCQQHDMLALVAHSEFFCVRCTGGPCKDF